MCCTQGFFLLFDLDPPSDPKGNLRLLDSKVLIAATGVKVTEKMRGSQVVKTNFSWAKMTSESSKVGKFRRYSLNIGSV